MEVDKSKILAQFIAGISGGTILGIAGFLGMIGRGGNYGCWEFIDFIFGTTGYESCGLFESVLGLIFGAIVGIIILNNIKTSHSLKIAVYLLFSAFIFSFIYGVVMFWPPFEDGDLLIVPPVILGFMLISIIPSGIITMVINWQKFSRKKK